MAIIDKGAGYVVAGGRCRRTQHAEEKHQRSLEDCADRVQQLRRLANSYFLILSRLPVDTLSVNQDRIHSPARSWPNPRIRIAGYPQSMDVIGLAIVVCWVLFTA